MPLYRNKLIAKYKHN